MSVLAALLSDRDVVLGLDVSTKKRLFEEIARHVERLHGLPYAQVLGSLDTREHLGCTALGSGVAIPHARIEGLARTIATYMRPKSPIQFDAPDRKPVSDVLALLVPEHASEEHLQILATLAQLFSDRRFREQLRGCTEAASIRRLFADWPNG
jgi:PTS system nitrogen regulatory IIA component